MAHTLQCPTSRRRDMPLIRRAMGVGSNRIELQVYCRNQRKPKLLKSIGLRSLPSMAIRPLVCVVERCCSETNNNYKAESSPASLFPSCKQRGLSAWNAGCEF